LSLSLDSEKSYISTSIYQHEQILANAKPNLTFFGNIFGNKKEEAKVAKIKTDSSEKISELTARLEQIRHEEQAHQVQYAEVIKICIKYWPDYPPEPFWSRLRDLKHSSQRGICKDCERKLGNRSGYLNHKKPLSMGGTNDSRNLVLLCGRCHQKRHTNLFSGPDKIKVGDLRDYQSLTINERLRLSLSEGKKIFIEYQDMSGVRTERWVRIKDFTYVRSRIWIKSHCYLREDERSFRVDRIKSASDRRRR
jgi:5-methylcytosine-specific restriction endonuclease McrA